MSRLQRSNSCYNVKKLDDEFLKKEKYKSLICEFPSLKLNPYYNNSLKDPFNNSKLSLFLSKTTSKFSSISTRDTNLETFKGTNYLKKNKVSNLKSQFDSDISVITATTDNIDLLFSKCCIIKNLGNCLVEFEIKNNK